MRILLGNGAFLLIAAGLTVAGTPMRADELLVMRYSCSVVGGQPELVGPSQLEPANEVDYHHRDLRGPVLAVRRGLAREHCLQQHVHTQAALHGRLHDALHCLLDEPPLYLAIQLQLFQDAT